MHYKGVLKIDRKIVAMGQKELQEALHNKQGTQKTLDRVQSVLAIDIQKMRETTEALNSCKLQMTLNIDMLVLFKKIVDNNKKALDLNTN